LPAVGRVGVKVSQLRLGAMMLGAAGNPTTAMRPRSVPAG
jgi:aryl-alcohol dehydrogenase-like predicted oxidoreductase